MILRQIAVLLTAGIAASFFLPWLTTPFGQVLVPYDIISNAGETDFSRLPSEIVAFLVSFCLAATLTILGLFGWFPKFLGLVMGAYPFALIGYLIFRANDAASQSFGSGIPFPDIGDFELLLQQAQEFVGAGMWLYFGCSLVLFFVAFIDPGRSSRPKVPESTTS